MHANRTPVNEALVAVDPDHGRILARPTHGGGLSGAGERLPPCQGGCRE
jgi:hypothetical protein